LDAALMRASPFVRRSAAGAAVALFAGFILGPLAVLALWSFAQQWFWPALVPTAFTLRWFTWAMVVPNIFHALKMSLLVASIVALATTVCALPAAIAVARYDFRFRNLLRALFSVPLLVPYISLGVGIASVFYTLRLNGTLLAVAMAHMIATLPFGILILTGAIEELRPEVEEAALSCGASPSLVFRTILLPQLVPALLAQGVYVFMLSLDEFTLTLLVSSPETATLPVQMFASIGEGYLQISSALAMLLLVPSVVLSLVIARFLRGSMTHVTA
jgi:putative spermidine/putrescine transport system permease protein